MQFPENFGSSEDLQAGLIALCNSMDSCFAYIGHYQTGEISHISKSIQSITGYSPDFFIEQGVNALRSIVHPEDMRGIMLILSETIKELNINFTTGNFTTNRKVINYHFRAKHFNGNWIPVDQKVFILTHLENGTPDLIFSIITPTVADFKKEFLNGEREKLLSEFEYLRIYLNNLTKLQNSGSQTNTEQLVEITTHLNPFRSVSNREKIVLKLISDGYATKEIADKLCLSFHTIETHRKNLLEKFNAKNSAELVKAASKYYWLE